MALVAQALQVAWVRHGPACPDGRDVVDVCRRRPTTCPADWLATQHRRPEFEPVTRVVELVSRHLLFRLPDGHRTPPPKGGGVSVRSVKNVCPDNLSGAASALITMI